MPENERLSLSTDQGEPRRPTLKEKFVEFCTLKVIYYNNKIKYLPLQYCNIFQRLFQSIHQVFNYLCAEAIATLILFLYAHLTSDQKNAV